VAEVSIEKAQSGSTLGKDVLLASGALLIREGTVLNDRQIQLMKQRGIQTVFIADGESSDESTEVTPLAYAERTKKLDELFAPIAQAPHMAAIREAARERLKLKRPWE